MGDLAALLTAIGGLITAAVGAWAVVVNTVRTRREPRRAADRVLDALLDAAADGQITPEEAARIRQLQQHEHDQREEDQG